ncbi:SUKH-3 domain-containing protein [Streptomyces xinghaiensis]|uniref:SUKH-3 domain-containing protein n=1 Tax=Streptomyces xinghaiensis TaxID=1038928 RepID=UPI00342AE1FC
MRAFDRTATDRFAVAVDAALRKAGWRPGRWDIRQAEMWADGLRAHVSPAGHRHTVFPAAVEAWAEFGGLRIAGAPAGLQVAPTTCLIDPMCGLHLARTLSDLGRALGTEICPLGEEAPGAEPGSGRAVLAVDSEGRVYSLDHAGDWFLGHSVDAALTTLVTGGRPERLTVDGG